MNTGSFFVLDDARAPLIRMVNNNIGFIIENSYRFQRTRHTCTGYPLKIDLLVITTITNPITRIINVGRVNISILNTSPIFNKTISIAIMMNVVNWFSRELLIKFF